MNKLTVLILILTIGCAAPGFDRLLESTDKFALADFIVDETALSLTDWWNVKREVLFEFGATDRVLTRHVRGEENYFVELVTFSNQKGAIAGYFFTEPSSYREVKINHYGRRVNESIQFVKGAYLISVSPSSNGTAEGAVELAETLSRRIRSRFAEPDIYATLPQTSRVESSEFCFMGEKAFTSKYSDELAEVLMIENVIEGYSAEYSFDEGSAVLMKIRYKTVLDAHEAMNNYIEKNTEARVLPSQPALQYFAVIQDTSNREDLVAARGEWLYLMKEVGHFGGGKNFFEFVLRGGR